MLPGGEGGRADAAEHRLWQAQGIAPLRDDELKQQGSEETFAFFNLLTFFGILLY